MGVQLMFVAAVLVEEQITANRSDIGVAISGECVGVFGLECVVLPRQSITCESAAVSR